MKRGPYRRKPPEERFWRFVPERPKDGCWLWYGSRDRGGYGRLQIGTRVRPKVERAHRTSWRIHRGVIPEQYEITHRCGNKSCVRPDHLRCVTHKTAMQLAAKRGVMGPGYERNHWRCRLTDEQVRHIRVLVQSGARQKDLAERYGVAPVTISNIVCERARLTAGFGFQR